MEQGAREIIKKQVEKLKTRVEKGAVKIGKRERAQKNGREQGEQGKMSKGAGSRDHTSPLTEPQNKAVKIVVLSCVFKHVQVLRQNTEFFAHFVVYYLALRVKVTG